MRRMPRLAPTTATVGRRESARSRRSRLAAATLGVLALAAVAPALSSASGPARLEGTFALTGQIEKTKGFPGETKGKVLSPTWKFAPKCASGVCNNVTLTRSLKAGKTQVVDMSGDGTNFVYKKTLKGSAKGNKKCKLKQVQTLRATVTEDTTIGGVPRASKISGRNDTVITIVKCKGFKKGRITAETHANYAGPRTDLPTPPRAEFAFGPPDPSITGMTNTVDFSNDSTDDGKIVSFHWDFGDPTSPDNTSTDAEPSHTYLTPGDHDVTLTVTDNDGETGSVTHRITVSP